MIRQSGSTYQTSKYMKGLFCSEAKVGKSSFLVASALGVLPWQKTGGIVDKPQNLHVISFDTAALQGLNKFLTQTCGAPKEALGYDVLNFEEDVRAVSLSQQEYDFSLFNALKVALTELQGKCTSGVHTVIFSSLTGVAQALERAIGGPPDKKGGGMDQSKWGTYGSQLNEIRNFGQVDRWHCMWEGHVFKPASTGQGGDARPETIQLSGKSGQNFPYNVGHVFRIRREMGRQYQGTKCDQVFLDTKPVFDFVSGGRGVTELLDPKEIDLTSVMDKLGFEVGGWNEKQRPATPTKLAATK